MKSSVCVLAAAVAAASPSPKPLLTDSVSGTIEVVDTRLNGIIVHSEGGDRIAWKLPAPAIKEASRYERGARVRVHYRGLQTGDRAVTALSFPGDGSEVTYVNGTGARVLLRTGAANADGGCASEPSSDGAAERMVARNRTAVMEPSCFCCAPPGKTCGLANHAVAGSRIVLAQCFP